MFLSGVTFLGSATNVYDYLQAADDDEMQRLFDQYLTELIATNVPLQTKFNILDIDISGGGDGHTFILRILRSTQAVASPPYGWTAAQLSSVLSAFWLGSTAEALSDLQEAAIASLKNPDLSNVAVGLAGSAKGTRFMAFAAGVETGG